MAFSSDNFQKYFGLEFIRIESLKMCDAFFPHTINEIRHSICIEEKSKKHCIWKMSGGNSRILIDFQLPETKFVIKKENRKKQSNTLTHTHSIQPIEPDH